MRKDRLLMIMGAVVLAILAYAWMDGGREPVRAISELVAVPEAVR